MKLIRQTATPKCSQSSSGCKPEPVLASLAAIVEAYLKVNARQEAEYLEFYANQKTLAEAITASALAKMRDGTRFSHQRRIPGHVLEQARHALLKTDLARVRCFRELYAIVGAAIRPIHGIGLVTIYDTAHRLGAYLKLTPEEVYLHAGVRKGARALGLPDWKDKLPMDVFPKEFQCLRPDQVEDCLCIYKDALERWAKRVRSR